MSSRAHYNLPPLPNAAAPSKPNGTAPVSDVLLFDREDGGDIEVANGVVSMSDGLATAAYLSLFGGNERDSGLQADDKLQYWGNLGERDSTRHLRSRTQNALRALPAIPANLRRLEDAAKADLAWMVGKVASSADATAAMPAVGKVSLKVSVVVSGVEYTYSFLEKWSVQK